MFCYLTSLFRACDGLRRWPGPDFRSRPWLAARLSRRMCGIPQTLVFPTWLSASQQDGRAWCTDSSCRLRSTPQYAFAAKLKAEGHALPKVHVIAKNRLTQYAVAASGYSAGTEDHPRERQNLMRAPRRMIPPASTDLPASPPLIKTLALTAPFG